MSTIVLARLIFSSSKYCWHRKCYSFKNCVALLPWFRDCHFDSSVSSNVRYVTCSHGTDCHAESPVGRVQCSKMAKIDPVSTFYPTLWLKKATLQWENLQEVWKSSLKAVNIYFYTTTAGLSWKFLNFDGVWQRFPWITLVNSQVCFKWMSKFVI